MEQRTGQQRHHVINQHGGHLHGDGHEYHDQLFGDGQPGSDGERAAGGDHIRHNRNLSGSEHHSDGQRERLQLCMEQRTGQQCHHFEYISGGHLHGDGHEYHHPLFSHGEPDGDGERAAGGDHIRHNGDLPRRDHDTDGQRDWLQLCMEQRTGQQCHHFEYIRGGHLHGDGHEYDHQLFGDGQSGSDSERAAGGAKHHGSFQCVSVQWPVQRECHGQRRLRNIHHLHLGRRCQYGQCSQHYGD